MTDKGKAFRTPLNAVRAFESAARFLNFTRAAAELGVTQGAVSRQVASLEHHLGQSLFRRVGRGIELTYEGEHYAEEVRRALANIESASARLMQRSEKAVLHVGATEGASRWLVRRLAEFQAAHKSVLVHLRVMATAQDIHGSGIDIALVDMFDESSSIATQELLQEELIVVCSPAKSPPRCIEALAGENLLHLASRQNLWPRWFAAAGIDNVDSLSGPLFDDQAMAIEAALQGQGYALVAKPAIESALAAGSLVAPYDISIASGRSYVLIWPKAKERLDKVRLFRNFMSQPAES